MIALTSQAKDQVKRLLEQQKAGAVLRVGVRGGGCSGMTYDVKIDTQAKADDRVFDNDGIQVVCDPKSIFYLDGMSLDFSTELVGGGFKFINPNATGTCGCGTSFTV